MIDIVPGLEHDPETALAEAAQRREVALVPARVVRGGRGPLVVTLYDNVLLV